MRSSLLVVGLLLLALVPPPASAQTNIAAIEPAVYHWIDYSVSHAPFTVRVTNTGPSADAFTITEVRLEPNVAGAAHAYSPTPTLPLAAGAQGTFHVWVGGLEDAPPAGPAAGDYKVHVQVQSTTDAARQQTVEATIRRSHPPAQASGVVTGSVHDAVTGEVPQSSEPIQVTAFSPNSVRAIAPAQARTTIDANGEFRLQLPPGRYWLMVEANGYLATMIGPLDLPAGREAHADLAISTADFARFESSPPRTVNLGMPTHRIAGSIDYASVAVTPGGVERSPTSPAENFALIGADTQIRWSRPLGARSEVPFETILWQAGDHGVDVSPDGFRVAVGTAAGTIDLYAIDGQLVSPPYRGESDDNPLIEGPLGQGILRSSEVRFDHAGIRLAAGTLTGWVYLFDAINGTKASNGQPLWKRATGGQIRALAFDPHDDRVYAASGDNKLYALDATSGAILWTAPLGIAPRHHIGMTNDGKLLVVGGADGVLRLLDDTGKQVWTKSHPAPLLGFDITPNGQRVITMTEHGVYSYERDGRLRWFRGDPDNHGQIRVGAGGNYISFGKTSRDGNEPSMRVLLPDGTLVWEHRVGETEAIHNVIAVEDGTRIVANGRSGKVYVFDHWATPPSDTPTGSTDPDRPGGGSPGPGALALLLVLGWVVLRRRRAA